MSNLPGKRFAINLFIVNYSATDQRICNGELDFVRLRVILAKTVKNSHKSHSGRVSQIVARSRG